MPLHTDTDLKRYIGFVTESHRDELKVVSVRLQLLDEKVDRKFADVEKKLDSHSEMIGRLLLDMEEVKSGKREKVDRKEFSALEAFVFGGKHTQKFPK